MKWSKRRDMAVRGTVMVTLNNISNSWWCGTRRCTEAATNNGGDAQRQQRGRMVVEKQGGHGEPGW